MKARVRLSMTIMRVIIRLSKKRKRRSACVENRVGDGGGFWPAPCFYLSNFICQYNRNNAHDEPEAPKATL